MPPLAPAPPENRFYSRARRQQRLTRASPGQLAYQLGDMRIVMLHSASQRKRRLHDYAAQLERRGESRDERRGISDSGATADYRCRAAEIFSTAARRRHFSRGRAATANAAMPRAAESDAPRRCSPNASSPLPPARARPLLQQMILLYRPLPQAY